MHRAGTIVVPNNGSFRHTAAVHSLLGVHKPDGTHVLLPQSGLVTQNLNRALRQLHGQWAWFQADDHVYPQDLLFRLLDHGADVVAPLCVRRSAPHHLVLGAERTFVDEFTGREYPAYEAAGLEEIPKEPFTVEIAGTAGMLVRRHVLEAVGDPWFESTDGLYLNEDIEFCRKVRAAGFQILVDPAAHIGHLVTVPMWPQ